MKITRLQIALTAAVALTFGLSSCQKEDPEECITEPTPMERTLSFTYDHQWGTEAFEYNMVYDVNGVNVQFTDIRFYLSNFVVMDDEGAMEMLDGVIVVDAGSADADPIDIVDLNHIHMLNFILGLDSLTNHADPIEAEAPLNDPTMHWTWNPDAGYKFVRVDGLMDPDNDGEYEAFEIHVATDALKRDMSLMVHQGVHGPIDVEVSVHYDQFFEGVDFSALEGTHGNTPTTNQIANNIQSNGLSIEE